MRPILICPHDRAEVGLLSELDSLATAPLLGHSVLEYWLSHLACSGAKEVLVIASDRPEQVQALVGNGSRWGMKLELVTETFELTPAQAASKYASDSQASDPRFAPVILEYFPGLPDCPLFTSYSHHFAALKAWMPRARTPERVGVHELAPGIWAGLHCHISPEAELRAPCWIGDHVFVGPRAVIGPDAVVEAGSFVEADARIEHSSVGPGTFVGKYVHLKDSLASGDRLVGWRTGMQAVIEDAFLLCSVRLSRPKRPATPLLERLAGFCAALKEDGSLWQKALLLKQDATPQPVAISSAEYDRPPGR